MAADQGKGNGFAIIIFVYFFNLQVQEAGKRFVSAPWSLFLGRGNTHSPLSCVLGPQTTGSGGAFRWGRRLGQARGWSLSTLLWALFELGLEDSSLQSPPQTTPHPSSPHPPPRACLRPSGVHRTPRNDSFIGRSCTDGFQAKFMTLASVYN